MTLQYFKNWIKQPELTIAVPANQVTLGGVTMVTCQKEERSERGTFATLLAERRCSTLSTSNPTMYQFLKHTTVDDMMALSQDMPVYEETLLELWYELRDAIGYLAAPRLSNNVAYAWEIIEQNRAKATRIK